MRDTSKEEESKIEEGKGKDNEKSLETERKRWNKKEGGRAEGIEMKVRRRGGIRKRRRGKGKEI